MKGLAALTIKHASITDEGLKSVKGTQSLQTLSLLYVPITDQAIDALREVPGLRTIRLYGTRMTRDGAERLGQTLHAEVDYQYGGFLGIAADRTRDRCVVDRVGSGSPAEQAGLLVEDLIYEYEGRPITNFDSLRSLIGKCRPGDIVTLKLIRGGEQLEKKVTLGERQ
jgi:S1-C subfamily serine protease